MTPFEAQQILNRAVRRGDVQRQPCEVCGATKSGRRPIDAHHRFGYDDPLNVVWLCRRHHLQEHGHPTEETYRAVLAALASGASQSAAARTCGVSRQRVHQIAFRERHGMQYRDRNAA